MARNKNKKMEWFRMDLHLHTPGSSDYQEPHISYLDILHQAEARNLDIIAFTDHNAVRGYAAMLDEIEQLEFLAELNRAEPDEERRLSEYQRLLDKILVLPGFEFTASFGFHVLGIFAPDTPVSFLQHVLLNLNVSREALETGDPISGSNADVLMAYRAINEAGGIVIAAHVNTNNGVMMLDKNWGGQTRIAYTQDANLHALEVTDLTKKGRRTTARFFDGTKPEYPRRMRCIQGSDAHRLTVTEHRGKRDLGVGDRVTEVLLPEVSFEALREMFLSNDFARSRAYRQTRDPYDPVQAAREEGVSIVQSFHEKMTRRNGHLFAVLSDICAMANTNGGTIYIGLNENPKDPPVGVNRVSQNIEQLYGEVDNRITPELTIQIDTQQTQGQSIIRIMVPRGDKQPYAIDENRFYIRDETETNLAVRDEIVQLILRTAGDLSTDVKESPSDGSSQTSTTDETIPIPGTGVEIVATDKRHGRLFHTVRDLRNGNTVSNVTRKSARHLWHYAIIQHENKEYEKQDIQWQGDIGMIKKTKRGNHVRYDLCQRENDHIRIYYGVTPDGMNDVWQRFLEDDE